MAVLVIAGGGRGSGKTAVGCALIAAMPELRWLAVKVTPHEHGDGAGRWEEAGRQLDGNSEKDTDRYLAAGARRAFLVRAGAQDALSLVGQARRLADDCDGMLVESNRVAAIAIAELGERAVQLAVVGGAYIDWKPSLGECLKSVDAVVLGFSASSREVELPLRFSLAEGQWESAELVRFVRGRLLG